MIVNIHIKWGMFTGVGSNSLNTYAIKTDDQWLFKLVIEKV